MRREKDWTDGSEDTGSNCSSSMYVVCSPHRRAAARKGDEWEQKHQTSSRRQVYAERISHFAERASFKLPFFLCGLDIEYS